MGSQMDDGNVNKSGQFRDVLFMTTCKRGCQDDKYWNKSIFNIDYRIE